MELGDHAQGVQTGAAPDLAGLAAGGLRLVEGGAAGDGIDVELMASTSKKWEHLEC